MNSRTPKWFKEWHDGAFWHFKSDVEGKLRLHSKLLWIILAGLIIASLIEKLVGEENESLSNQADWSIV